MFGGLTQQQGKMTESKLKISCVLLPFIFWDDKQLCQWDWVVIVLGYLETLAVQIKRAHSITQDRRSADSVLLLAINKEEK